MTKEKRRKKSITPNIELNEKGDVIQGVMRMRALEDIQAESGRPITFPVTIRQSKSKKGKRI